MGALSREAILAADDLKVETVAVSEWGGDVIVRELTAAQRQALFDAMHGKPDTERSSIFRRMVLSAALVDDAGARLFDEASIDTLFAKSGQVIDRIAEVAVRLSGLGKDAEGDAKNG